MKNLSNARRRKLRRRRLSLQLKRQREVVTKIQQPRLKRVKRSNMQPPPRKTSPRLRKKNIIRRASRKRLQSPRLSRSRSEGKTMKRIRLRQLKTLLIKLTNQRSPSQQKNLRRLRRPTPSKSPPKRRSPSRSLT